MRGLFVAMVLVLMVPSATGEVALRVHGDGPMIAGVLAQHDGLQNHHDLALRLESHRFAMDTTSMHDHHGLSWMLHHPAPFGNVTILAKNSDYEATATGEPGPPGRISRGTHLILDGAQLRLEAPSHLTGLYRIETGGRLLAQGVLQGSGTMPLAALDQGMNVKVEIFLMISGEWGLIETSASVPASSSLLPPLPNLLGPDQERPPTCTGVHFEPQEWYTGTHVRVSRDTANAFQATGLQKVSYTLDGPERSYTAHVQDPFGHVLLRALSPGPHNLTVNHGEATCRMAFQVQETRGTTEPFYGLDAFPGGFDLMFDTGTSAHYGVDVLVLDDMLVLYAGRLHTHGGGAHARFEVPPGEYEVRLDPSPQGPEMAPLRATVAVDDQLPLDDLDARMPIPGGVIMGAIARTMLGRRR